MFSDLKWVYSRHHTLKEHLADGERTRLSRHQQMVEEMSKQKQIVGHNKINENNKNNINVNVPPIFPTQINIMDDVNMMNDGGSISFSHHNEYSSASSSFSSSSSTSSSPLPSSPPCINPYDFSSVYNAIMHSSAIQRHLFSTSPILKSSPSSSPTSFSPLPFQSDMDFKVKSSLQSMFTSISPSTVSPVVFLLRKSLRSMYERIKVNLEGIERLEYYQKNKIPFVLMPMHKSHIDYLLVSYILYAYKIFPPTIIAGDNLNMGGIGQLLRNGGALFIRRSFHDDILYKLVFSEYVGILMENGINFEVFIEGTRSRHGKLKTPKTGFLSTIMELYCDTKRNIHKNLQIIPIAISYDQLIESPTFVSELMGEKKKPESIKGLMNGINHIIRLNFGSIDINIGEGRGLGDMIREYGMPMISHTIVANHEINSKQHAEDSPSHPDIPHVDMDTLSPPSSSASSTATPPLSPPLLYSLLSPSDRRKLTSSIAFHVLYSMNLLLTISSTSMVSTIFLTELSRGIHISHLIQRVEWLRGELVTRGAAVSDIFQLESTAKIVMKTLKSLKPLLAENHNIYHSFRNQSWLTLSMYRNQLIHHFVQEALIAIAVAAEYKDNINTNTNSAVMVPRSTLIHSVAFLSKLFKFEFIWKSSPHIQDNIDNTIEAMVTQHRILVRHTDKEGNICFAINVKETEKIDYFLFLCMLLYPFVELYWIALASLMCLCDDRIHPPPSSSSTSSSPSSSSSPSPSILLDEKTVSSLASKGAESSFYSGALDFYETMAIENIKQVYQWAAVEGILKIHRSSSSGSGGSASGSEGVGDSMFQLTGEYSRKGGKKMIELVERIGRYRKTRSNYTTVMNMFVEGYHKTEGSITPKIISMFSKSKL